MAASNGLYNTQLCHEGYYKANRTNRSMIYSPDVVFFRDERFTLMKQPVTASVLTLPAVNYGQVVLKEAEHVMKDRMRLALGIFSQKGAKHLILGVYGCSVFRNDPVKNATW